MGLRTGIREGTKTGSGQRHGPGLQVVGEKLVRTDGEREQDENKKKKKRTGRTGFKEVSGERN